MATNYSGSNPSKLIVGGRVLGLDGVLSTDRMLTKVGTGLGCGMFSTGTDAINAVVDVYDAMLPSLE